MSRESPLAGALRDKGFSGRAIQRGEVYLIKDEVLSLPETRLPGLERELHERRPVLVVQGDEDNTNVFCRTVLVAPLSTRTDLKGKQDIELSCKETGLSRPSIAMLGLVQPILKTDLAPGVGRLSEECFTDVLNTLLCNLGVLNRQSGR